MADEGENFFPYDAAEWNYWLCDECGCLIDLKADPEAYDEAQCRWVCRECRGG